MFDLQQARKTKGTPEDRLQFDDPEVPETPAHPLDSPEMDQLHTKLLEHYRQELDRQQENRFQMAIDEDFYDNIQWTEEDAQTLKDRGQAPMVYNVISQSVNWIIGSEKRGRVDFKVLPREKNDGKPAERKTALMKYLSDVNRTPFHRSRAFADCVKVGVGWLEDGAQDDDDSEIIYSRYESWRNMLWDSSSTELDLADCRYVFRVKWVDVDVAKAMFPDRAALIELAKVEGYTAGMDYENADDPMDQPEFERQGYGVSRPNYTHSRQRVRLIEAWFRKPVPGKRLRGGRLHGELYEAANMQHDEALRTGESVLADKLLMRMHCAIMTTTGMCYHGESPYRHNRFPFTPIWCYRRGRDGMPYGYIRGLRDIQEDINKRASKALYILSTNKVVMDDDALVDMSLDEFREEVARPDAIIRKKRGAELVLNADRDLSQYQLELMSRNIQMIQQVSGVTDELMGRTTNAQSGIAVERRQQQGALSTSAVFDNLRLANQIQGEKQLSLIEQFFTEEKQFRITNMRGTPEYITINDGLPENDIIRTKADFVIGEADWRQSMRQAQLDQLIEMMNKMPPEVGLMVLDLVVESMDVPNRDEMVKRIRQMTGARDPDQEEPTPEEQAAEQAKAEAAELQKRQLMAQVRKDEATAAKAEADAQKSQSATIGQNVSAQQSALMAAREALLTPGAVPIADGILKQSGWPEPLPPVPEQPMAPPADPAAPPAQPAPEGAPVPM